MTASELRQKYLQFFKEKGHTIIPSASLIPENDPTVLFTTAGMHPLVPYLMGESHPEGKRLANAQKCIRTGDIEEVGDTTHHTFFEMLGNWSLGDYFKKEAIEMSFEFLTKELELDINRLAVSVFKGDSDASFDEEAFNIWKELGIPEARIAKLSKEENWWGPAGQTGPCGPDSEIFYWVGDPDKIPESFNDDNNLWVEIWNNVFMQYDKKENGSYELAGQKNIDTGMGLERVLSVLNDYDDNYKTEIWSSLIKKIEELSGKKYGESEEITRTIRIIADHIKATTFIIGDNKGIPPSNTDQGYIVRRLIRRAIVHGRRLGVDINKVWMVNITEQVVEDYKDTYNELEKNKEFIKKTIEEEENKFQKTLENGLKEFNKQCEVLSKVDDCKGVIISGEIAFKLFATYGFPIELTEEIAKENNMKVDKTGFEEEMKKHQDLSRTASAGKFKGGLADSGEETKKLHTAAHLLLAALRKVLGDHVIQKGSNITAERLRFDFSHSEKLTDEQKLEVERLVNEQIKNSLSIVCEEKSLDEAREEKAMGVFDSKYGNRVKVYKMGEGDNVFSHEICGGPHVNNTSELGEFKIKKEQSSSSGVRRIKAILK